MSNRPKVHFSNSVQAAAALASLVALSLLPAAALAQLSGDNLGGDLGLKAGSQAPPGFYTGYALYEYDVDKIVLDELEIDIEQLSQTFHVIPIVYVSDKTLWGANYGFSLILPWTDIAIQAPQADIEAGKVAFTDMYVQPINLGWHSPRADVTTWYAFFAPTGDLEDGVSLGMWAYELALGTTVYFDEAQTWHAAAVGQLEFHGNKEDRDAQPGTLLTIEGGAGHVIKRIFDVGLAYYLQWKVTDDEGEDLADFVDELGKNRNFGFGPEINVIIPVSHDLSRLLIADLRYLWETGTELDTQGDILTFSLIFKAF